MTTQKTATEQFTIVLPSGMTKQGLFDDVAEVAGGTPTITEKQEKFETKVGYDEADTFAKQKRVSGVQVAVDIVNGLDQHDPNCKFKIKWLEDVEVPNPITKNDFAKARILSELFGILKNYKMTLAQKRAQKELESLSGGEIK